ncbi:hypothetical protein NYZ99_00700 [Maribacter litopenaei]|uniref:Adhesin domain-containing protein n=1 Tax=Maribacter litopenaei TaxID=2976127 RepID=A0ABY5Y8J6_9FLAO|nr:hypothetical protein [Maribacter litopenaei]UWX55188.1 hypothetical protein NYZ99_00700 [Maribacter litopenaei]
MKKLVSILIFGLISLSLSAQKTIEENISYTNQYIDIEMKFASDINIKTWEKSSVYIKADIQMKDEQYLDLFKLDIENNANKIKVTSNSESVFKKMWEDYEKKYGKKKYYFSGENEYEFNYTVYVPKNARFKVSSINGDMRSDIIEGDFTAELINGNIDITKFTGNLDLSTINGEIDLKMTDVSLVAETIHGDIYADEKLKFEYADRHVGSKISGKTANGTNKLKLNTINGNMYLRY